MYDLYRPALVPKAPLHLCHGTGISRRSTPDPNANVAALQKLADQFFAFAAFRKRCGICGSTSLKWDQGKTKFKTKEEAIKAMNIAEGEQLLTRAILDQMGISFDSKQENKNN